MKKEMTLDGFTIRAEVDAFGLLRIAVDAGKKQADLFQVLTLDPAWSKSLEGAPVIFSTDDRLAAMERGEIYDPELTRAVAGDRKFRALCESLGEDAVKILDGITNPKASRAE